MEDWEARLAIKHMGDPNEREVARLFLDAGLELVTFHAPIPQDTGDEGEDDGSHNVGEIDLLFRHNDTAFIVEVSVQREKGRKLKKFFEVFSRTETLESLKRRCPEIANVQNFKRIYFDMRHLYNEKELDDIGAPIAGEGNHIVLKDEFGRIQAWIRKKSADRFLEVALTRSGSGTINVPDDG